MEISIESLGTQALTKAHLSEILFKQIGLNKREAKGIVDAVFDTIVQTLVAQDAVKLSGFGSFYVRAKSARPGRNPRTGEAVAIKARYVANFYASPKLKKQIEGSVSN